MKSTIKEKEIKKESYPVLKEATTTIGKIVVMFSSEGIGVVVGSTRTSRLVGHHSINWCMDSFESFKGKIILENE